MIKKVLYFLVLVIIFSFLLLPFYIKVKIECKAQTGPCPSEINTKLRELNSKSLFKARRSVSAIVKSSFLVSDFSTQFKLPNVLSINIIIKKPKFAILNKSTNKYNLIDGSGIILSLSDNSNLPTIVKEDVGQKPGDIISEEDLFSLKLIEGLYQMYQISIGTIQNDTLVVDLPSGIRVIFPLRDSDRDILLGALRLIYAKVTTESEVKYSQIDMRYKNPVLR